MDIETFRIEAEVEATHWWFVGRRRLLSRLIEDFGLPRQAPVLDVGTGTGSNLRLLKDLGYRNVRGVDPSGEAIAWCTEKGLGPVEKGDACDLPFDDGEFDLVLATDVIEHLEDDSRALREFARVLRRRGKLILTVPAFESLWGLQDEVAHHLRRYRMRQLRPLVRRAGLSRLDSFHFNYILFLPILAARRLMRLFRVKVGSENAVNTKLLNRILTSVFGFDVRSAPILRPFWGVSILVLAEKPDAAGAAEATGALPKRS